MSSKYNNNNHESNDDNNDNSDNNINNDKSNNNIFYSNYRESSIYDDYNINGNNTNNINNENYDNHDNENNNNNNSKKIVLNNESKDLIAKQNKQKLIENNGIQSNYSSFGSYTSESNFTPSLTSFGHRPISASRTFNPCTMRIHLKHDEIVKTTKKKRKTGFGLSPMVLAKLLHAPKLRNYDDKNSDDFFTENQSNPYDHPDSISINRNELFLSSHDMIDFGISKER